MKINKLLLIGFLFSALFLVTACSKEVAEENQVPQPNGNQGQVACTMEAKICPDGSAVGRSGPNCEFAACPVAVVSPLTYNNDQYGFTLNLLPDWEGYTVSTSTVEYGSKIVIRHPKWTAAAPREDIPVLVYPLAQWQKWEANNFENYPTAAPMGPTERGRNSQYVFATAPRYNYDFQTGYEDVENIIKDLKATTQVK